MKKMILAVVVLALLAGMSSCGDDGVKEAASVSYEMSETAGTTATSAETTVTEETTVTTETSETEVTTTVTTTTVTTTVTTPVVTTTVAATTAPPVTTTAAVTAPPAPVSGTTSKGYTITTVDGVTYVDGILVANKSYPLPSTYYTGGLTAETNAAFGKLKTAAAAAGLNIYMKSGFRSYADQRYIYNGYVARDGQAAADTYSARAGHSEHQSGMAIDVNSLYTSFGDTPEGIWLRDNCHLYGFIIRYPKGKESITGYMYEPWHIRYVGVETAGKIKASGLCFEEYFGITSVYGY